MSKIPKEAVLYFPAVYVSPGGTRCGTCRDFIRLTSECEITDDPAVSSEYGTCGLYVMGTPHEYGIPLRLIPKYVAGYIEGREAPTYCGRCRYYESPMQTRSVCSVVGDTETDKVDFGGCCNRYEAKS